MMKTQKNQTGKDQRIEVERLDVEELEPRVAPLVVLKPPRMVGSTLDGI